MLRPVSIPPRRRNDMSGMTKKFLKLVDDLEVADDTLGGRIEKARVARGLSVAQLARRVGVLSKTVKNWETDRSEPRASKMQMLAGVLSVPPIWLLGGEQNFRHADTPVNVDKTAGLETKVERLLALHQESAKLIFELQSEVLRLQGEIDTRGIHLKTDPDSAIRD